MISIRVIAIVITQNPICTSAALQPFILDAKHELKASWSLAIHRWQSRNELDPPLEELVSTYSDRDQNRAYQRRPGPPAAAMRGSKNDELQR